MQLVAHFLFFNVEIVLVVFVGLHDDGHAVGDGDAITGEADAFCGVIGNQADAGESEVSQNLCCPCRNHAGREQNPGVR